MKTESEVWEIRSFEKIAAAVKRIPPSPIPPPPEAGGKVDPPVVEKPFRFTRPLNLADLSKTASLLTTEAEVDAFVAELGNKLKSYIRDNKNVRLVWEESP